MTANARNVTNSMMNWLVGQWQWPTACLFTACVLLLLTPIWFYLLGAALALVYLQLPIYMVHQGEEHIGDRFRRYFNQQFAGGREALTPTATFWINSIGVWGLNIVALYLAVFVDLSFGLMAVYLTLVNGLVHIRGAIAEQEYNPGLWTGVALFMPIGGWSLYEVSVQSGATWADHALGVGVVIVVHAAIIVYVLRRIVRLRREVGETAGQPRRQGTMHGAT